jgi:hypothetical protein
MFSLEYPKTENLLARGEDHRLVAGELRKPEFGLPCAWHVTEKIDGFNLRVVYCPADGTVSVRGRSDRANIPDDLRANVNAMLPAQRLADQFDEYLGSDGSTVTLYGEAYGPGIQRGGGYREDKSVRFFDALYMRPQAIGPEGGDRRYAASWCNPSTVEWLCGLLSIPYVPVLSRSATLDEVTMIVSNQIGREPGHKHSSRAAQEDGGEGKAAEGVVCRTDPYLFTHGGSRLMFKLKVEDLERGLA